MDLNEILKNEYLDMDTICCGYKLNISPERNVYNAIRKKYKALAFTASEKFRQMDLKFVDISDLVNNAPNAFIVAIEDVLMEVLQDIISVNIYDVDKQKVIDDAFNGTYFDEFSLAYKEFSGRANIILSNLNDSKLYREYKKENRPRWQSATIGGNAINAWSNQLDAAAMNFAEGMAYSVINAIGNSIDEANAKKALESTFKDKKLRDNLIYSVYESAFNLHLLLIAIINQANIGIVNDEEKNQANAMYNNFMSINLTPEKKEYFIKKIFELNPYEKKFYKGLIDKIGDEDNSFSKFADYFCIDAYKLKKELIIEFSTNHLGSTEDDAYKCKSETLKYANHIGLTENDIDEAKSIIDIQLKKLDKIYRTVDSIEFDTRTEADRAKSELSKINEILKNISKPEKDPTLSYERNLIEKKKAIEDLSTKVKEKYIDIVNKYLADFDRNFKTISILDKAPTREEAVKKKALNIVKKSKYRTMNDIDEMKNTLKEYVKDRGVPFEELTEANELLNQIQNDIRQGIVRTPKKVLYTIIIISFIVLAFFRLDSDFAAISFIAIFAFLLRIALLGGAALGIYKLFFSKKNKKQNDEKHDLDSEK